MRHHAVAKLCLLHPLQQCAEIGVVHAAAATADIEPVPMQKETLEFGLHDFSFLDPIIGAAAEDDGRRRLPMPVNVNDGLQFPIHDLNHTFLVFPRHRGKPGRFAQEAVVVRCHDQGAGVCEFGNALDRRRIGLDRQLPDRILQPIREMGFFGSI